MVSEIDTKEVVERSRLILTLPTSKYGGFPVVALHLSVSLAEAQTVMRPNHRKEGGGSGILGEVVKIYTNHIHPFARSNYSIRCGQWPWRSTELPE